MSGYEATLLRHYHRVWKGATFVAEDEVVQKGARYEELPAGFRVYRSVDARPSAITYATVGMSGTETALGIELYLLAPEPSKFLPVILASVAWYHHQHHALGVGHVVNFGYPWFEKSRCSRGLLSLPYLDGPDLENYSDGSVTRQILWLIPITEAERELRIESGLEALEEQFDYTQFNYLNPWRPCTVKGWVRP